MKVLVIPTTDWIRHPFPNRLNFIFDILAKEHQVFVLHFQLERFKDNPPRGTSCTLVPAGSVAALDPSMYYIRSAPRHLKVILDTVRDHDIDVILSANILPSFLANFTGVPIVFDYLDHLEESASVYYPRSIKAQAVKKGVSMITRYNLTHARRVITVTAELKDYLEGIGVSGVDIIPNGVDASLLRPLDRDEAKAALGLIGPVIGYVGSLEYWVDLEMAVRALSKIDATLLVVGPALFTDYGERLHSLAQELGVADRVVFTGAVPYADLSRYISAMDVGLNPLRMMKKNEYAAGGKVFNYLSCGRPVLSSRMISLVRLLGDKLYYYDDMASFVEQVKAILQSSSREKEYRDVARKYDWHALARDYGRVMEGAL